MSNRVGVVLSVDGSTAGIRNVLFKKIFTMDKVQQKKEIVSMIDNTVKYFVTIGSPRKAVKSYFNSCELVGFHRVKSELPVYIY